MNRRSIRANFLLLIAAIVWGFAFAFQKMGTDYLGSVSFNGVRFIMAAIALIPAVYIFGDGTFLERLIPSISEIFAGICAGAALFLAALFQQAGIEYTTAGKTGFITCLYMVIVPVYGLFRKQKVHATLWLAVILAVTGMYFLSVDERFTLQKGDIIVFIGAFIWAAHIIIVDIFNPKVNPLKFSLVQFAVAAFFSTLTAFITERDTLTFNNISLAIIPLLYAGVCSAAIGYTLQIIGQKDAKPAPAALILSTEAVFGVVGGYLLLGETLGGREIFGCVLMIAGVLLAQYKDLTANPVQDTSAESAG